MLLTSASKTSTAGRKRKPQRPPSPSLTAVDSESSIHGEAEGLAQEYIQTSAERNKKKAKLGLVDDLLLRRLGFRLRGIVRRTDTSVVKKAVKDVDIEVEVKVTEKSQIPGSQLRERIFNELTLAGSLRHRNLLDYLLSLETNYRVYLVWRSPSHGSLEDYIRMNLSIKETLALGMMGQLLTGVDYLHRENCIAHRNITPTNIAVYENYILKLGNLELGLRHDPGSHLYDCQGPIHYSAPEVRRCEGHNPFSADVWSLGAVFYEMLTGRVLYHDLRLDLTRSFQPSMSRTDSRIVRETKAAFTSIRVPQMSSQHLQTTQAGGGGGGPERSKRDVFSMLEGPPPQAFGRSARQGLEFMLHLVPEKRHTVKSLVAMDIFKPIEEKIMPTVKRLSGSRRRRTNA